MCSSDLAGRITGFEHFARPENCSFRTGIESFRIEQRALIVIAEQAGVALHHQIDALTGVRTVTDDIAEAVNLFDSLRLDIGEDGFQSLEIAVDVADYSSQEPAAPRRLRKIHLQVCYSQTKTTV